MRNLKNRTSIGVIGLGRVGTAFALQCERAGLTVAAIQDTDENALNRAMRLLKRTLSTDDRSLSACSVVIVSVPDREIDTVAESILTRRLIDTETMLVHTSGVHSWDTDDVRRRFGIRAGSIHPLMAFPPDPENARSFEGIGFLLDGDETVVDRLHGMVERFRGIPMRIHRDQRALYHAAAVFASNFPVLLQGIAHRILMHAGLDRETVQRVLNSLLDSVRHNLAYEEPDRALSGPAVREDWDTIRVHIEHLDACFPEYTALYRVLSNACITNRKNLKPDG